MNKIQKVLVGMLSAFTLALAPFNSAHAQAYEPDDPEYYFHIVAYWSPHPFWTTFAKGAMDAAKHYNVKVINEQFPKEDHQAQADRVDEVRANNPDGMVVSIGNMGLIEGPVRRAIEAGIPVYAANGNDNRPPDQRIPLIGFAGMDSVEDGRTVAREMLKVRPVKHIVIANQHPGHAILEARAKGIREVMEPLGVKVTVLAITMNPTETLERFRAHWTKHPETDAFTTLSAEPHNQIARDFFKEEGLLDKVLNITFDMSTDTLEATKNGEMLGMMDSQVYLQGYLPIAMLYLYKKYGFQMGNLNTGNFFVHKGNAEMVGEGIEGGWRR